jgi:hypothetical protein
LSRTGTAEPASPGDNDRNGCGRSHCTASHQRDNSDYLPQRNDGASACRCCTGRYEADRRRATDGAPVPNDVFFSIYRQSLTTSTLRRGHGFTSTSAVVASVEKKPPNICERSPVPDEPSRSREARAEAPTSALCITTAQSRIRRYRVEPELLRMESGYSRAGTTDVDVQVNLKIACGTVNTRTSKTRSETPSSNPTLTWSGDGLPTMTAVDYSTANCSMAEHAPFVSELRAVKRVDRST